MYEPSHQEIQPTDTSNTRMNNNLSYNKNPCKRSIMKSILINLLIDAQYKQEEINFVNDMQNCSLTCNEGANVESPNSLHLNANSVQKQSKQGPKNSNGKDSSHQIQQKGKQTGTVKGDNNNLINYITNIFSYCLSLFKSVRLFQLHEKII